DVAPRGHQDLPVKIEAVEREGAGRLIILHPVEGLAGNLDLEAPGVPLGQVPVVGTLPGHQRLPTNIQSHLNVSRDLEVQADPIGRLKDLTFEQDPQELLLGVHYLQREALTLQDALELPELPAVLVDAQDAQGEVRRLAR